MTRTVRRTPAPPARLGLGARAHQLIITLLCAVFALSVGAGSAKADAIGLQARGIAAGLQAKAIAALTPEMYGVIGDGASHYPTNENGLAKMFTDCAAKGVPVFIPGRVYITKQELVDTTCPIYGEPGATLRAFGTFTGSSVLTIGSASVAATNIIVANLTLDALDNAARALWLRNYQHVTTRDILAENATQYHIQAGDASISGSFEWIGQNIQTWRTQGSIAAASAAVFIDTNASDTQLDCCILTDADYGVLATSGHNSFHNLHAWAHPARGWMSIGIYDQAQWNKWEDVQVDTVSTYCARFTQSRMIVHNFDCYNNNITGTDNQVIGLYFNNQFPTGDFSNLQFHGQDNTHRIKQDITTAAGAWNPNGSNYLGVQEANVITQDQQAFASTGTTGAITMVAQGYGNTLQWNTTPFIGCTTSFCSVDFQSNNGTNTANRFKVSFDGSSQILAATYMSGTISPTALSGDVNDYNPTSLSSATTLRIDPNGSARNITGLQGGADGRVIRIVNIGSANIVLKSQSASSSAANRFTLSAGDTTLVPNQTISLFYDGTAGAWRPM